MRVYHRTTREAEAAILAEGRMVSRENTGDVFVSTWANGMADGYGPSVVELEVPAGWLELDDEFPSGEQHFRVRASRVRRVHILGSVTTPT